MIAYEFEPEKAMELAAHFLRLAGGRMRLNKLSQLLYLAERTSLLEEGYPICGDQFWCDKDIGPTLRRIRGWIAGETPSIEWNRHFARLDRDVELRSDPGARRLCQADREIAENLWRRHACDECGDLLALTRSLPEGRNSRPGREMPVERLLRLVGKSEAEIAGYAADAEEDRAIRREMAEPAPEPIHV
jgi:hypothetical protein